MATITKSIGTSADPARDYSTITLWEAALGGAAGGAGNDADGECYADSDFDEDVVLDDATPDSILLTVPEAERHDGTADSGVRVLCSTSRGLNVTTNVPTIVEWLEWDVNGNPPDHTTYSIFKSSGDDPTFRNNILHDVYEDPSGSNTRGILIGDPGVVTNNIIYDLQSDGTANRHMHGILVGSSSGDAASIYNNTVWNIRRESTAGNVWGISIDDDVVVKVAKNNIAMGISAFSGTELCFENISGYTNSVFDYNLSSDDSLPDALHNVESKAAANQFISTVDGSEDLHLKAGADAIGAGTDLGTTPDGVQYDINNFDRHTAAVVWDIGADQYVAVVSGNPWYYYAQQGAAA